MERLLKGVTMSWLPNYEFVQLEFEYSSTVSLADTWYLNRALLPEHQEAMMSLLEGIKILRAVRETFGGAPDMINP